MWDGKRRNTWRKVESYKREMERFLEDIFKQLTEKGETKEAWDETVMTDDGWSKKKRPDRAPLAASQGVTENILNRTRGPQTGRTRGFSLSPQTQSNRGRALMQHPARTR